MIAPKAAAGHHYQCLLHYSEPVAICILYLSEYRICLVLNACSRALLTAAATGLVVRLGISRC